MWKGTGEMGCYGWRELSNPVLGAGYHAPCSKVNEAGETLTLARHEPGSAAHLLEAVKLTAL